MKQLYMMVNMEEDGKALAEHALNFQGGMEWYKQRKSIMKGEEDAS